jgi:hypothetical protein
MLTDGSAFRGSAGCKVLESTDKDGIHELGKMACVVLGNPVSVITDVEALFIRAMGRRNVKPEQLSRSRAIDAGEVTQNATVPSVLSLKFSE